MYYSDTKDDSRRNLRLALELIGKYDLPTDPTNYCVWYEYVSGQNQGLKNAIDNHIETKKEITSKQIQDFYDTHIDGHRERLISLVQNEFNNLLVEVTKSVDATKRQLSESGNSFETINETLVPGLSRSDVDAIVHKIKDEIKGIEFSSDSAKERLQQATDEINHLKSKMAQYKTEAIRDPLTQVSNRRGFDIKLKEMIGAANNSTTPLCLIIADIDHFKRINDTFGHLVGDSILRLVAQAIKDSVKGKDLLARIGGEEFAVLLPDTPHEGAMKLADNIRLSIERLDLKKKDSGESLGKISLSFGVTAYQRGEETENFFQRADKALYHSKETGRNRVTGF
jgi:diguanylate cyclase